MSAGKRRHRHKAQAAMQRKSKPTWILVALAALFIVEAGGAIRSDSPTWDETHYLGIGQYLFETGRWDIPDSIVHPPLSFYLNSIPFLSVTTDLAIFMRPPPPVTDPGYLDFLGTADLPRGRALLSNAANADDALLTESRFMMVGIGVLLGAFVWVWSDARYGAASGVLAAALFAIDPNILAHSHLITPDICVTAFSFIGVYYLWQFLSTSHTRYAWLCGLTLGLALLSKFTGLLMLPVSASLVALWRASGRPVRWRGCGIVIAVMAAVWLVGYGFNPTPYFQGLAFQHEHAAGGEAGFLLGKISSHGWWYYFAAAFALKTPLGLIALLGASIVMWIRRPETWLDDSFLIIPSVAVFAFFSVEHQQSIGLRYILPIYPFLIVLASRTAILATAKGTGRVLVGLAVAWSTVSSFWVFPHYLAYFNELIGGPSHGYRYLADSNLDWGQELKDLKRFMDDHHIANVNLSYFGTDAPERYGIAYTALASLVLPKSAPRAPSPLPAGSWVAISATMLQGVYVDDPAVREFRTRTPTAVLGYGMFLYHLPQRSSEVTGAQPAGSERPRRAP
jgi:4-amino-4-deoxy-L-arabinose transferase-like glycosyltransferase